MTLAAYRVYEQITPGGQMPPGLWWMIGAIALGIVIFGFGFQIGRCFPWRQR